MCLIQFRIRLVGSIKPHGRVHNIFFMGRALLLLLSFACVALLYGSNAIRRVADYWLLAVICWCFVVYWFRSCFYLLRKFFDERIFETYQQYSFANY